MAASKVMVLKPKKDATYAKTYEQVLTLGKNLHFFEHGSWSCRRASACAEEFVGHARRGPLCWLPRNGIKAIHPYM